MPLGTLGRENQQSPRSIRWKWPQPSGVTPNDHGAPNSQRQKIRPRSWSEYKTSARTSVPSGSISGDIASGPCERQRRIGHLFKRAGHGPFEQAGTITSRRSRRSVVSTTLTPQQMKEFVRNHFEDFVNRRKAAVIRTNM